MSDGFDLSEDEALALCRERGVPLEKFSSRRQLLSWLIANQEQTGLDPKRILQAMFPHNPRNKR